MNHSVERSSSRAVVDRRAMSPGRAPRSTSEPWARIAASFCSSQGDTSTRSVTCSSGVACTARRAPMIFSIVFTDERGWVAKRRRSVPKDGPRRDTPPCWRPRQPAGSRDGCAHDRDGRSDRHGRRTSPGFRTELADVHHEAVHRFFEGNVAPAGRPGADSGTFASAYPSILGSPAPRISSASARSAARCVSEPTWGDDGSPRARCARRARVPPAASDSSSGCPNTASRLDDLTATFLTGPQTGPVWARSVLDAAAHRPMLLHRPCRLAREMPQHRLADATSWVHGADRTSRDSGTR